MTTTENMRRVKIPQRGGSGSRLSMRDGVRASRQLHRRSSNPSRSQQLRVQEIGAAVVLSDEAKTFLVIEEFYDAAS